LGVRGGENERRGRKREILSKRKVTFPLAQRV
jgi:hypothetical protein